MSTDNMLWDETPAPEPTAPAPGSLVIDKTRFPRVLQPWIHTFHVGVVQEADPTPYPNPVYSEALICQEQKKVPVLYPFGRMLEYRNNLIVITQEQAQANHREQIKMWLGEEALSNFDQACPYKERETC